MGKLKDTLKRGAHYVFEGVPVHKVEVNVAQIHYGGILKGKHVLITGGSRGLGFAIAKKALKEQAMVCITGRSLENLEQAKEKLGRSPNLFIIENDIREISKHDNVIKEACNKMGGIDILVNNAGVSVHDITYLTCTESQWDMQVDTNLKGTYFMTQAFMKYYEKSGLSNGKIIIMASERGLYGDDVPYGLVKRALISYTEGLAVRLINKGVRVNAIAPGVTATDMTGYSPDGDLYRKYARGKRILLPEEIAETAVFLMSDASNCISGQVIACNEANHLK